MRQKPFDLIIPLIKGEGRVFRVEFDKKENLAALTNKFYKFGLEKANWFPEQELAQEGEALKPLQVLDLFSKLNAKDLKIPQDVAQSLYGFYYERSAEVLKNADPAELAAWKGSVNAIFTIMEKMKEVAGKDVAPAPAPDVPQQGTTATEGAPVETTNAETAPTESVDPTEDPRLKLFQNFQDLKDAIENKNQEYFGVEENVSI